MIFVDSSVWIDYFNGAKATHTDALHAVLGIEPVIIGDLVLVEVLQGYSSQKDFDHALNILRLYPQVSLGGWLLALKAARNFRFLRSKGFTVRKTIDSIIATRCIENNYVLLHNDRDYLPFAEYLELDCHPGSLKK